MPRKRVVMLDQEEDIISYEHHIQGRFVRVLVGHGSIMPDGSFSASIEQNYENIMIQDEAYDSLLSENDTKPQGVFRKDDLWEFVDIVRDNVIAERQSILKKDNEIVIGKNE